MEFNENRISRVVLRDPEGTVDHLTNSIRTTVRNNRLRGCVVAVSGGIDSSVCLALAAQAVGSSRVVGLALPDRDSSPDSLALARTVCDRFDVELLVHSVTEPLSTLKCYEQQHLAVTAIVPSYSSEVHLFRVAYEQDFGDPASLPKFMLVVEDADGAKGRYRLDESTYLRLIAATNMKQRVRMLVTHFESESRRYAVVGTSNKIEIEQGFFVRYGDGTGDVVPLRSMFKTQVYDLAKHLGVPKGIIDREPTTDTYSAPQTQEEFFYGLPRIANDVLWDAFRNGESVDIVASECELTMEFVRNVFGAYRRKIELARRLRASGLD